MSVIRTRAMARYVCKVTRIGSEFIATPDFMKNALVVFVAIAEITNGKVWAEMLG